MNPSYNKLMIPDRVTLQSGWGGLPVLELRFNGAEAQVYLHGGHVLHYQPAGQPPVLWQSGKSFFEPGKPIRGGIPICWPWFGPHPNDPKQPAHGVARLIEWELVHTMATAESTSVTLKLPASAYPDASLRLKVELSRTLFVTLTTTNTSDKDLIFAEALHTYFAIGDIHSVSVTGLEGQQFIDKLSATKAIQTQTGPITFSAETELVYTKAPQTCTLIDPVMQRNIMVSKENSLSTVVWNPWIEKSIRMPDFGDEEYLNMLCIETANCGFDTVALAPGQIHSMHLLIQSQSN